MILKVFNLYVPPSGKKVWRFKYKFKEAGDEQKQVDLLQSIPFKANASDDFAVKSDGQHSKMKWWTKGMLLSDSNVQKIQRHILTELNKCCVSLHSAFYKLLLSIRSILPI